MTDDQRSQRPVWLGQDERRWDHVRLHVQLLKDPRIGAYEIAAYFGLAVHAELATGRCFPAVPTLAGYARVSDRTIQRALRSLQAAGYIRIEATPGTASTYSLLPPPPLPRGDTQSPVGGDSRAAPVVTEGHRGGDSGADEQEPITRSRKRLSEGEPDGSLPIDFPQADPQPVDALAWQLVRSAHSERARKPVRFRWPDVARTVTELLENGIDRSAVHRALMDAPAWTPSSLQVELDKRTNGHDAKDASEDMRGNYAEASGWGALRKGTAR